MKIEVKIDDSCTEPKIVIVTDRMTDEVNGIIDRLSEKQPQMIAGFRDGQATLLDATRIYRVYASGGKVYAETADGTYILRMRLYEAEQRLTGKIVHKKFSISLLTNTQRSGIVLAVKEIEC